MGNDASIIIRPTLKVNDRKCDLSLLINPKIIITTIDHWGIPVTKTFSDIKIHEGSEIKVEFPVPAGLENVKLDFTAEVKNISKGSNDKLNYCQAYGLTNFKHNVQFYESYLRKINGVYYIYVLGKNGEPLEDTSVTFTFTH